ncbi:MAG: Sir2 family NAD-dependent protein deacetylase [Marinagarivorans sp.]
MQKPKIVVFTGAGVSAESGIATFRDGNGLWHNHRIEDVASPQGWARNPQLVLDFYNQRRAEIARAQPNAAHKAIAELERAFDVSVVTQNIDDLHERGGSSHVLHLHGEIIKARSCVDEADIYSIGYADIKLGDTSTTGHQLRPYIVWFGEAVPLYEEAEDIIAQADKILVIGTSLSVFPAAYLLQSAQADAEKVLVGPAMDKVPRGYQYIADTAVGAVPPLVAQWLGK